MATEHFDTNELLQRLSVADVERIYQDLTNSAPTGTGRERYFKARCHDDQNPSLRVLVSPDGRGRRGDWYCDPCKRGGDLFSFVQAAKGCSFPEAVRHVAEFAGMVSESDAPPPKMRLVATYVYRNADGTPRFEELRYEDGQGNKTFKIRHRGPDGTDVWAMPEGPRVPYNLPLLVERPGARVYIPEGTKGVDRITLEGAVATTNALGAGKWGPDETAALAGRPEVIVLPDNDPPGHDHGQKVAAAVYDQVAVVKVVELPGLPPKGDVVDWLDAGHSLAELDEIAAAAPQWQPAQNDSAAGVSISSPAETNLGARVFLTPEELSCGKDAGEIDWLWEGFLAPGHITLLAGKPRASGKSTLTFGLLRALLRGEAFLGFTTRQVTGVVVLSEETPLTLLDKTSLFGLSQCCQLLIAPRHTTARLTWAEAIETAVAKAKKVGAELLAVDSFPHFAKLPKDGAKDASLINEAFRPLQAATAEGLAVLLIHHERKGGGEAGEGVRDSGAIVASSDIILELGRIDRPSSRKLELLSRFRSSPSDFVFDFDKETGQYTYLGTVEEFQDSQKEAEREASARKIAALLPAGAGLTQKEVAEKASLGKSQVGELLHKAVRLDLARRTGRGTRNDPYRYSRVDDIDSGGGAAEEGTSGPSHSGELFGDADQD